MKSTEMLFIFLLVILSGSEPVFLEEGGIIVNVSENKGAVRKGTFGNNLIGYDPMTYEDWAKEYYGYSDYGAGIWDPKSGELVKEVVELAKNAGITVLRFPGGCGVHHYDWKSAIGNQRRHFLYGLDEFMKTCVEIGVDPIITVSYFTGNERDAAELVEYLNGGNEKKDKWSAERAKNGNKQPFGVKYYEIGNEDWHGDHGNIKGVRPEEYANRYLKYYSAMKAVDPSIKIGASLYTSEWNRRVMEIIRDKIDFGIIHIYPSPGVDRETLEGMEAKDIFSISFAVPMMSDEYNLREAVILLKKQSGKDVPLGITEYNGGYYQDKPVPYRHCLGTALINAELLRVFSKEENNILFANYWQFNNSYWGMISNGFDGNPKDLRNPYFKRPNYYVFETYHKHFGDILISADVKCDSFDARVYRPLKFLMKRLKTGTLIKNNLVSGEWVITESAGVGAQEKAGVLRIDFMESTQFNYYHARKAAAVEPGAYYKLSGNIKTEELIDETGVFLEAQDARGWSQTKSASATERVKGTTDWKYVEVIYETLPDAKAVNVLVRRGGEKVPLKGKAYFKDVKLEKFIPSLDTKIPFLSVNVSKSVDGKKVFLMVINKNMDAPMTSKIDLKDFALASKGNAWVLNGPSVDATNEKKHDNVKVSHQKFEIKGNPFDFTFEPHSLTAIEIEEK